MMVRVRIAPSPTGFAHVGTGYIALFNYAFAKHETGIFVLRLEDTDVKREVKGAEEAIYSGLAWLGLSWDEGPDVGGKYAPYKQSERLDLYKDRAKELLDKGLAYEEDGAVRFKNPGKDISWNDMVRGKVTFSGGEVGDFVIIKSDGFPTYHFGVVVDDIAMKITHVIRGEDHTSNTPKHIALYNAFGVESPIFGHLPTLRNAETGKKLSKRTDTVDLRVFREQGYLPEALVNFMCLQGWSHPEGKDIFGLEEFVHEFDIKRVRKSSPKFDLTKLDWINSQYIMKLADDDFVRRIKEFAPKDADEDVFKKIAPLIKERIKKLSDFQNFAGFFFERPKVDKQSLAGSAGKKLFGENYKRHLEVAMSGIEKGEDLMILVKKNNFKTGDFFMDLRIAIAGSKFTPPINESIEILGKDESVERIKEVLE